MTDLHTPKEPDLGGVRIGVEGGAAWVNPSKIRVLSAAWKDGATGLALVYDDGSPGFTPMDIEEAHRIVTEVRAAWNK